MENHREMSNFSWNWAIWSHYTPNGWLKCLKKQEESVIKGYEKAGIIEAVKSAQDIYTGCKNPFDERCRK